MDKNKILDRVINMALFTLGIFIINIIKKIKMTKRVLSVLRKL